MSKTLKAVRPEKCNGCELCVLESQRQLEKVGLEESLIRVFTGKV
jgi:NAD-dependent dihydropyrimidine dehydrogenase PreA subunit